MDYSTACLLWRKLLRANVSTTKSVARRLKCCQGKGVADLKMAGQTFGHNQLPTFKDLWKHLCNRKTTDLGKSCANLFYHSFETPPLPSPSPKKQQTESLADLLSWHFYAIFSLFFFWGGGGGGGGYAAEYSENFGYIFVITPHQTGPCPCPC